MHEGHNPYLVVLSVAIAIIGGYTGFGLAARVRRAQASRRLFLALAAAFLALSIWTMHFIGMLAAPVPAGAVYLVLPTILSLLICTLVVGVSLFFVSIGEPSELRIRASALLLGTGIVSMHYVGVHGLVGNFSMQHNPAFVALATLIAVGAGYGGLRIFLSSQDAKRLAPSATAFGIAVSGMHYTAMYGMSFATGMHDAPMDMGPVASPQAWLLIVSLPCFVVMAGFLLILVPEPQPRTEARQGNQPDMVGQEVDLPPADSFPPQGSESSVTGRSPFPLGGLGQPRMSIAKRVPVAVTEGTQFIDAMEIRSIRADAHYTLVHDGARERMSPWSISEAEAQLDSASFLRVHRSYIVAIQHVTMIRKEGDGAIVEMDGATPNFVPVSRAKITELRARLGLRRPQESSKSK
jgi:NO-binding membrane sensor protein with MHYT domain